MYERYLSQMLFNNCENTSTAGKGWLANKMQRLAQGRAKALLASALETKTKWNIPTDPIVQVPVDISPANGTTFDYWVRIPDLFTKMDGVLIPCKSHKRLNEALKNHWKISKSAYLTCNKKEFYVIVFLSKTVDVASPNPKEVVGIDVGVVHSLVSSEGHFGHGLTKVLNLQKKRQAARQKARAILEKKGKEANHKNLPPAFKFKGKTKSYVKQLLDIEAKNMIRRAKHSKQSLIVEDPKVLALLGNKHLHGWASTYLANRLQVLGHEEEVYVGFINPYLTSITCSKCGCVDKKSRVNRGLFICTHCGNTVHADLNAARNIALKGATSLGGNATAIRGRFYKASTT